MKITRKQLRKLLAESLNLARKPNILQVDYEDSYLHNEENEYHAHFVNELGNNIEIGIKDFGCGSANQLTISIIGPNSETENTITRMEAEYLNQLLCDYLENTQASIE